MAIENHLSNTDNDELFCDIQNMCKAISEKSNYTFRINNINDIQNKENIVEGMMPFLRLYYRYEYSKCIIIRKRSLRLLKTELKSFFKINPLFGRRILYFKNKNNASPFVSDKPIVQLSDETKTFLRIISSH